jgi:hypothetical protein
MEMDMLAPLYRIGWFLLMILVMAPAFILAGTVDGITYKEASGIIYHGMQDTFSCPEALALFLNPVVTFVARLLPVSSFIPVLAGEMLWEHIGVFFTFIFFASIRPPYFAEVESKYGARQEQAA